LVNNIGSTEIAICTFYTGQVLEIKDQLSNPQISVATVDGYQGQESPIFILDFVRSNTRGVVGFLCEQRINVALTRAKHSLIIVGHYATLQKASTRPDGYVGKHICSELVSYLEKEKSIIHLQPQQSLSFLWKDEKVLVTELQNQQVQKNFQITNKIQYKKKQNKQKRKKQPNNHNKYYNKYPNYYNHTNQNQKNNHNQNNHNQNNHNQAEQQITTSKTTTQRPQRSKLKWQKKDTTNITTNPQ